MGLEHHLEIFIVTYNREKFLKQTLGFLVGSAVKDCKLTILDNCSTDNTASLYEEFKSFFPRLKFVTNPVNIGANANILRTFDYTNSKYTWILCDDDDIDLTNFDDVAREIEKGEVDLIHTGAHEEYKDYEGGKLDTPRKLLSGGYNYFKFGSFLPCNIFKTELFKTLLIDSYNNIGNSYPHLPFLINIYERDQPVYISKHQLVTASPVGQSYGWQKWVFWWLRSSQLLKGKDDVRICFLDQFGGTNLPGVKGAMAATFRAYIISTISGKKEIQNFINDYLKPLDKMLFYKFLMSHKIRKVKSAT